MVGLGVLLAYPPGAPAPTTRDVQLTSTGFAFPLAPSDPLGWLGDGNGSDLFGLSGFTTPTLTALTPTALLQPIVGPGGWLIGDGLDADPATCTAPCKGP